MKELAAIMNNHDQWQSLSLWTYIQMFLVVHLSTRMPQIISITWFPSFLVYSCVYGCSRCGILQTQSGCQRIVQQLLAVSFYGNAGNNGQTELINLYFLSQGLVSCLTRSLPFQYCYFKKPNGRFQTNLHRMILGRDFHFEQFVVRLFGFIIKLSSSVIHALSSSMQVIKMMELISFRN